MPWHPSFALGMVLCCAWDSFHGCYLLKFIEPAGYQLRFVDDFMCETSDAAGALRCIRCGVCASAAAAVCRKCHGGCSGIGSLQWLAGTTRGDLSADVSLLQKPPSDLSADDLREVNKVSKYARATSSAFFKVIPHDINEMLFIAYGDSGWANAPRCKSQGGYVVVATNKKVLESEQPASLLDWKSYRRQRILRSTLAAKAASLDRAHNAGQFMACVFSEMTDPSFRATCGSPLK